MASLVGLHEGSQHFALIILKRPLFDLPQGVEAAQGGGLPRLRATNVRACRFASSPRSKNWIVLVKRRR